MALQRGISTNSVQITISTPTFPVGAVEQFGIDADPWSPDKVESADLLSTVDGYGIPFSKNVVKSGTLTLAPTSPIRNLLNTLLQLQDGTITNGAVKFEAQDITMVIQSPESGFVTTYSDGIVSAGDVDEKIGKEKLENREYTFKFMKMVKLPLNTIS